MTRAPEHDDALMVVARALCRVRRIDLTDSVDLTEKLDLRDRVQAVIYAYETGVVAPGSTL